MKTKPPETNKPWPMASFEEQPPARFCFTWALPGGAWVEWGGFLTTDAEGRAAVTQYRNWLPFYEIIRRYGQVWLDRQRTAQGWATGCWIDTV